MLFLSLRKCVRYAAEINKTPRNACLFNVRAKQCSKQQRKDRKNLIENDKIK